MIHAVPWFLGERLAALDVPEPHRRLDPDVPAGPAQQRMGILYRQLADAVADDERPVVWAGDCVAVIGALAGLERRRVRPHLVWFDAHGDFNTWETTPSGFLGGMPLAMITGRGEQTIVTAAGLTPIADSRVWLVGARDLDPGERRALDESGVRRLDVDEVSRTAVPSGPIHLHLDVDVVDPADMPAVSYPVTGGPTLATVAAAVHHLATGNVVSVTTSTWDPTRPQADRAAAATRHLLAPFL